MALLQLTNYPVPPYAARIHRNNLWPILLITAVWIAWLVMYANNSIAIVMFSMAIYIIIVLIFAAPSFLKIIKLCRRLTESEFRICTECGFDLRTLPDRHQCPECGSTYDYDTLKKQWKEWRDTRAPFCRSNRDTRT